MQDSEKSEDELESSLFRCIPQYQGQDDTENSENPSASETAQPHDVSYKIIVIRVS